MGLSRASKYLAAGKEIVASAISKPARMYYGRKAKKAERDADVLRKAKAYKDVPMSAKTPEGRASMVYKAEAMKVRKRYKK